MQAFSSAGGATVAWLVISSAYGATVTLIILLPVSTRQIHQLLITIILTTLIPFLSTFSFPFYYKTKLFFSCFTQGKNSFVACKKLLLANQTQPPRIKALRSLFHSTTCTKRVSLKSDKVKV